ncbi:MAG TPA: hypothetical protein VF173_05650 [Thermoanaerobaculia bacterium]|nr:hypothetical protein [Thermoanaerobaculia bacterium]
MNGGSRQRTLLIVLACVAVLTAWVYLRPLLHLGGGDDAAATPAPGAGRPLGEPGEEAPARPQRAVREVRSAQPGDRVAVLKMASLDHVPSEEKVGRDPWRYVDPPPPKPVIHVPSADELRRMEEERRRAAEAAAAAAAEAARIAAIPKPPEFTMEYLGNFGPVNKKIAVFSNGKQTVNALEGDVIEKKFIVAHIGYESVDIKYVDFPNVAPKRLGVRRR